ncbi:hypothetical protein B0T19DRAFT_467033 [Cercophora scortea]|uniref:Uncharacterized protein n=1 Tax=Cercophora scortea TaxID=314031 RepID=A0AAE0M599_9PEZI|nr:hypothetical protein B0T19DRAFT_467033 [Cercophora scortea]
MPGVLSLPVEIFEKVAKATVSATVYCPADRLESQATLYRLCLTSRWFNHAITPELYRHVVLSRYLDSTYSASITVESYSSDYDCASDRLILFLRTLLESPRHRALVRILDCRLYLKDIPPLYRLIVAREDEYLYPTRAYINDYAGILKSWTQHGAEIQRNFVSGRYDKHADAIFRHAGLHRVRSGELFIVSHDIGQRMFAAILCLTRELQALIIRSAPVPAFDDPAEADLKGTMCYGLASDLIVSALYMRQLRPCTLPNLKSFTVAPEPCAELRRDPYFPEFKTTREYVYAPYWYEIFADICPGVVRAPNLATLEIAGLTFTGPGDNGWELVTTMMPDNITRVSANHCRLLQLIPLKPRRIKELVLDIGRTSPQMSFGHVEVDAALMHLRHTLETLDFVAPFHPTCIRYNADCFDTIETDVPARLLCWPRMEKLKHLRVTLRMLFGWSKKDSELTLAEVLPPNLVSVRIDEQLVMRQYAFHEIGGEIDMVHQGNIIANGLAPAVPSPMQGSSNSEWTSSGSDEELDSRIRYLVVFARKCSITHPGLRRVCFGDSGLAEDKRIIDRREYGGLSDFEPPPVPWGRRDYYDKHKKFRDEWRPRLRNLFAASGVSFTWVAADAVYYR